MAAGGTVGHLEPALVVADELRSRGCEVSFIGSSGRIEEQLVPARGYPLATFPISGIPRRPGPGQVTALSRALIAIGRCSQLISQVRPHVVLGGGGYVSAPAAAAARGRRIPVVVTEADAHLGLANRFAARFADRLCVAFPVPQHRAKQVVTGRPVAPAFFEVDAGRARESYGVAPDDRVVAVVGGSGGARRLSELVWQAWGDDGELTADSRKVWVMHVTGRRDRERFPGSAANERYRLIEYCDDMPALLGAADVVVSRAGGSLFELAAVGRAAVLVPFPHATGDHQRKNAAYFTAHEAALVLEERSCTPQSLRAQVEALLLDDERRAGLAGECARLARPDAAMHVADTVLDVANNTAAFT